MQKTDDSSDTESEKPSSPEEADLHKDHNVEQDDCNILKNKLTEAYSQNEDLHSKYLRVFADLENVKKRIIRDREEASHRTRLQIFEDLLPVIDAFKMGMDEAQKEQPDGPVVNGFKMTLSQLQSVLEEYGLTCIEETGVSFDPKFHEAIGHQAGDEDDLVIKVVRKGYKLRDYLMRPATVIISKKSQQPES